MERHRLDDPALFTNRELSWLSFNARVLEEAQDEKSPLFERLKFLGIFSSNLDEFFMVRVAGLKQQLMVGIEDTAADGMSPADQLAAISEQAKALVSQQYDTWNRLLPELKRHGVTLRNTADLDDDQKGLAEDIFLSSVFPALTPLGVDPAHPFPHLRNKSLNVAVLLRARKEKPKKPKKNQKKKGKRKAPRETAFAVVQVPRVLRRLVELPGSNGGGSRFLLLEDLISAHAEHLFPGFKVLETAFFRVTRNWDLSIDEDESDDLMLTIQEELRRRDRGASVRVEISAPASMQMEETLRNSLALSDDDVYRIAGPLQVQDLHVLTDLVRAPSLRIDNHTPAASRVFRDAESVVDVIRTRDVLLHHPYESFDPVVRFISEAADDPDVLAIKQTLYRTSGDSPFVHALMRAAENGKDVAVLVEIKARFDEWNNITWARRLEESGVHVIYGVVGFKTHCKVALVVRREEAGIRRYVHMGTGNYNVTTARIYTDLSLFTARADVTEEASSLFNVLTGYANPPSWKKLVVAPSNLRNRIIELIQTEAQRAREGKSSRIMAKMNSLVDPKVIRELYMASQAGVQIQLLVRGICCLRAGVPGISENIQVRSIVDRFLEHSRIFVFGTGSRTQAFASSADWMPRNFLRRIEVMFPVEDEKIRDRIVDEIIGLAFKDNVKARELQPDGTYKNAERADKDKKLRSQYALIEAAKRNNSEPIPPLRASTSD